MAIPCPLHLGSSLDGFHMALTLTDMDGPVHLLWGFDLVLNVYLGCPFYVSPCPSQHLSSDTATHISNKTKGCQENIERCLEAEIPLFHLFHGMSFLVVNPPKNVNLFLISEKLIPPAPPPPPLCCDAPLPHLNPTVTSGPNLNLIFSVKPTLTSLHPLTHSKGHWAHFLELVLTLSHWLSFLCNL